MKKDLGHYRKNYKQYTLEINATPDNPLQLFKQWFDEVDATFTDTEVNAMTLTTVTPEATPQSRIVLLKSFSDDGFIFYTNYNSAKGQSISKNANVCASFFWEPAERQVIIIGEARKISAEQSDAYFKSRPLDSQLGAIISNQSQVLDASVDLTKTFEDLKSKYINSDELPKRPKNWGGYIIEPKTIEFWQGRPNRLHDRVLYSKNKKTWIKSRLYP